VLPLYNVTSGVLPLYNVTSAVLPLYNVTSAVLPPVFYFIFLKLTQSCFKCEIAFFVFKKGF
jgi:hypothetical protein